MRLGILAAIACLPMALVAAPRAEAGTAALLAANVSANGMPAASNSTIPVILHHRRKAISAYCYPRNYWWFYRPYTTANDGHQRCMPYFHYPAQGPYQQRGNAYERPVK
jgi:hypothetical protein